MFIHVNSDDYLERHYTEETADWCNRETRTSSVQQWIERRPWVQLVPGPTYAINEYKRKHYQLRCVPLMVEIMGRLAMLRSHVQWSQDYSSILCLPISDPVPKSRVMLKTLYRRDVDISRISFLATPSGILIS